MTVNKSFLVRGTARFGACRYKTAKILVAFINHEPDQVTGVAIISEIGMSLNIEYIKYLIDNVIQLLIISM